MLTTMMSRNLVLFNLLLLSFQVCNSNPLFGQCFDRSPYNTNTTYGRTFNNNLNSLLSALLSNASSRPNGFYNYTAGSGEGAAYGLFLCRGDVKPSDCQDCLKAARSDMSRLCHYQNWATIWYDYCMLRYSNESIFSQRNTFIPGYMSSPKNVTADASLFNRVLAETLDQIVNQAANGDPNSSGKKFAVREANYTPFQRIYALGQCTPDLSNLDCVSCLQQAIGMLPKCCNNSDGGRVSYPSCNIRYESYRFYNQVPSSPEPLPPDPATTSNKDKGGVSTTTIVAIVVPIGVILGYVVVFCLVRKAKKKQNVVDQTSGLSSIRSSEESLKYNFSQVQACTNSFAVQNRIGEGGFGSVYKGTLPNGQTVAVKRLSRGSSQSIEAFINEIVLVAKLQHKNLVRLLGYCLEGEEQLLIFEFVLNRSLDFFLFDQEKRSLLNWIKRYKIITGIAKGLLYLHEDSRLKIIHRDLKASNVLLDQNMNPKIADFGMARLFEIDQSEANTSIIAGTYGYMAPEYAMHGKFSVKSDVFSFGVLVLEIISGQKNSSFFQSQGNEDLLSYSWRLWRDGTPLALLDPFISKSYNKMEVIQCIHIGLLCVQEDVEARPTMASVALMLNSFSVTLPTPKPPAFFCSSRRTERSSSEQPVEQLNLSVNKHSITELHPR